MHSNFEFDLILENIVKRAILEIPAGKCAWAKNSEGGCSMCGFNGKNSLKSKITLFGKPWPNFLTKAYINLELRREKLSESTVLAVFNGGSFLNPREVPIEIQEFIAALCAQNENICRLFIESRCEFVTDKNLTVINRFIGNSKLEVAVGLESKNDEIRNNILKKGLGLKTYEKAISVIHRNNAYAFTYVFLKPPFISEKLAVEECIQTIHYAFEVGSDVVSISCGSVQKGSSLYDIWRKGNYRPPWLWSIAHIIEATYYDGPVRIGTFEDEPMPIDFPRNCGKCDESINYFFDLFRKTHDLKYLSQCNRTTCDCKKHEWILEGIC